MYNILQRSVPFLDTTISAYLLQHNNKMNVGYELYPFYAVVLPIRVHDTTEQIIHTHVSLLHVAAL